MSAENLEVARQLREALIAGGPEAAAPYFDPEVTFDVAVGQYAGLDGMTEWFGTIIKYLVDYEIAEPEFIDAGDAVVVNNRIKARGGHTKLAIQDQYFLLRFREGRVIRVTRHASEAEALAMAETPDGAGGRS
jgi:SnoaL-like domain